MIVTVPKTVLNKKAKKVQKIDKKVKKVIEDLKKDLVEADKPKGVGLAAPQIGISLRIFIIKPTKKSPIRVFINPEIIWKSAKTSEIIHNDKKRGERNKRLEGCLSIPNVWGYVKRSNKVKLKYVDENGDQQEEDFSGFEAIIIQHEVDHLNGIMFPQRVVEQKRKLYQIERNEAGEEKLVEIDI